MKQLSRSLVSVLFVVMMVSTAFSLLVTAPTSAHDVVKGGGVNMPTRNQNDISKLKAGADGVQPSLAKKIVNKGMVDVLIPTTDVPALYNFVKDYRYEGLIGPNAGNKGVSVIRLKVDSGIVNDIAGIHGVLGVYDVGTPVKTDSFLESGLAGSDGATRPSSVSSTEEHLADRAWDLGYTGKGVKVATMDTGVDFGHYDLNGQQARAPETAEQVGEIVIDSTTGNESGKTFALEHFPVVPGSLTLTTYDGKTFKDVPASNYTVDFPNGLIELNENVGAGLRITANYTYDSPYANWPIAFDPISMSSFLSSGGQPSGWYVDTSRTDIHNYHTVVVDGVNDFWNERDALGGASSVYSINETTDLRGTDKLNDMQNPAFDLGGLYITSDMQNFYFGFEKHPSLVNMSYGIYIDTATGGALTDPEGNAIQADTSHSPEYAIYVPHIGVRWGVTASGALWSENDTFTEPKFYQWDGGSWQSARALTTLGTMVIGEHVATGDNTTTDTSASLAHGNISSSTFRLYINGTPFPTDGYSVNWETGEISFAEDLPYLSEITADYDYSPDPNNAASFAASGNFMEFGIPKALLANPGCINMEVFTVGNNQSHAQDTTPSDPNVDYSSPDWDMSVSTTLTSFASRNSTPVSYIVGDIPSKSGVYHIGYDPDENLATYFFGRPVAMLLTDEFKAGVYDTIYVDLDNDKDFRDEKPVSLYGVYKPSEGISPLTGSVLYSNFTVKIGDSIYSLYKAYLGDFSGYQELLRGDGHTLVGEFNDTNVKPYSETVYDVFRGSNLVFNNDTTVFYAAKEYPKLSTFSFYLPYQNVVNYTYMQLYVPAYNTILNLSKYYSVNVNKLSGLVTVTCTNYPVPKDSKIFAWFTYDKTNELSPLSDYSVDWDTGKITLSVVPSSSEVIYTTHYNYYFRNETCNALYEPFDGMAFIERNGQNVTVQVRTETIYKDIDHEGMKGDGNVSYPDLSGGMVYFISRADKGMDYFTAKSGQTQFNLTHGNINPASIYVYLNGSLMDKSQYSVSAGSRVADGAITLKSVEFPGSIISVVYEYNTIPIPYSETFSERKGVTNVLPTNGNLVCLFGDFSLDAAKGTEVASDIAAVGKGVDGRGNTLVKGMAPDSKLIAIRGGDPFDGWYFAAEGYDGLVGTGDEANIIANSFSYAIPQSGWDLYSRFADYIVTDYSGGKTAIVSGAGSSPSYGYGTIAAPGAGRDVITVGVGTDFHYRNYNPRAPRDLMRMYGDGGSNPQDSEVLPSSARGPTMTGNPKPDIVASGSFCYGDTPLNVDQNKYSSGWEWEGGRWAWDLWSGDALSSAVASGGLAVVYQAYHDANGEYPTAQVAKKILMSAADNLNYDVFSQGAGSLNVYKACLIASQKDGVSVDKNMWVPGNFHGKSYRNFVNLAYPGSTYNQTFKITNYNTTAADVTVKGEIFKKFSERTVKMDMNKFYDDRDTPGVMNIMPYIPPETEFMRVTATVPYADGYTNMGELFDWTDNGNGVLEFPSEQNRIEYCINSNILQLNIRDPLSKAHTGLAIQIKGFGGTAVKDPWTIKMEFFSKTTWDWMSVEPSQFTLNGGSSRDVTATISIPDDAPAGTYEGGIYVIQNFKNMPVAVGDGQVMNYSNMYANPYLDRWWNINNTIVFSGDAVVLPGSATFTFIPYHEVFDAPAENTTIALRNTTESDYILWHTVNSSISHSPGAQPGGDANTTRDWHMMNESAVPGKYNYTVDTQTHTIHLNGWHLNPGERVTIYFMNGSRNLTEGADFEPGNGGDYSSIKVSETLDSILNSDSNSTIVASYCFSRTGGTYTGAMRRNVVSGSVTLYNEGKKWDQYADVTGENVINASGGETTLQLEHGNVIMGSLALYSNGTMIPDSSVSVKNEQLVSSAAGGEQVFSLAHGNAISSSIHLHLNNTELNQLAEIDPVHPEACFNATSTPVAGENVGATAVNQSGHWIVTTSHNLAGEKVAVKPGSYTLYRNGAPLTAGIDFTAMKNESDGLLTGEFEVFNYDSGATYTMDYSYYNPYISSGYLAHGNVIEDSYKIYRDGFKMETMDYDINLTSGEIILHERLKADEYITAVYSYNTYLVSDGVIKLTDPLKAGDSLSIAYDYMPYTVSLPTGSVTLADPLSVGENITADYRYAVFNTDLVRGEVKLDHWLYPGSVLNGDYSVYQMVVPVVVNIPTEFPDVRFGGAPAVPQDMYNNSAVYGGADTRFYFVDIPTTGLYKDPGNRQFFIDTSWGSAGTDIDTTVYSPSRQTSYPGASFNSEGIGLYSMSKSGGSTPTSGVFTTTGGPEETLFSPMKNGLNILSLHGTIMNGSDSSEAFSGKMGLIDVSNSEINIETSSLRGQKSIHTMASIDRYGISGAAAGPSSPQSYPNEVIYQDDPDWSHYDTYIDQLLTGKYTRAVEVSDSALIFDVHITSKDCPDLDLAVFLDGDSNGDHVVDSKDDPSFLDGKPEASEFVAMCADADADEEVTLVTPAPGTYLIRVYGFDVPGGKGTFNLDITLVQGTGFKVSGEDSRIIPAYQPKELNITWNFDESSPDGTFMGAFYIGTYNAPMSMLLPVTLTLERTPPEITEVKPTASQVVNTGMPAISAAYDDPSADTGQEIVVRSHIGPAHLWRASPDEWKTTISKTEVPGSGINAGATRMFLDSVDVTDKITSTDTVATYTPSQPLMDGVHTVTLIAEDVAGNEVQTSWSFVVDTQAPEFNLSGISDDGVVYTQSGNYTLSGSAEAGSTVSINGAPVEIGADGSFSSSVALSEGANLITISVTDAAGNRNVREISIYRDTTAPSVSISVSGPRIRSVPSVTVSGNVDLISEVGPVSVTVNGEPVVVHTDGTFTADVSLVEGVNTITVVATDAAGNSATKEISVTVDSTAPSLSLDPVPSTVSTKQLTLSGSVESGAKVYVNGKQVVASSGRFSTQVSLSRGNNLITVSAVDAAGNSVEYSLSVEYQPEDDISALTASTTSQAAPALTSTAAMLIVLAAIIFLIIGFVASRFIGGKGGEGGGDVAAVQVVHEEPVEEEEEAEEVEEELRETEEEFPEETEEVEEESKETEEPADISDEILEEAIDEESEALDEVPVEEGPFDLGSAVEKGKELLAAGDTVAAMETFENVVENAPDEVDGYLGQAQVFDATGKWGKALQMVNKALEVNSQSTEAMAMKGDIFAGQGKTEMARSAYEQALEIEPGNTDIRNKLEKLD